MIQFGTIKFRKSFKNYFVQFVWTEKSHYNRRFSLYEAPTKNQCKQARRTQCASSQTRFQVASQYADEINRRRL